MDNVKGPTRRESREVAFDVLRPIVRVLRARGFEEGVIRNAAERACRLYTRSPLRGVRLDRTRIAELAKVVETWARDPAFIDESGAPMRLGLDGGGGSFRALLRRAQCALAPREALAELIALGSIRPCDRGQRVRLLSGVAAPALESIRRFAETIEHNLGANARRGADRLHRCVTCTSLDPGQLGEVQRFVRSNGESFLEALADKLSACSQRSKRRGPTYGVGVYVFVDQRKPGRPKARGIRGRTRRAPRR